MHRVTKHSLKISLPGKLKREKEPNKTQKGRTQIQREIERETLQMKSKRETTVIEIEDTDDDDFLSQVAQAESEALSASNIKRRKITTVGFNENQENTKTTTTTIKVKDEYKNEGDYMAALKGSKSTLWQQRIKAVGSSKLPPPDYNARGGGGGGAVAPEKVCPCGLGVCNVFTANTERNRGRDFYKCPQRQVKIRILTVRVLHSCALKLRSFLWFCFCVGKWGLWIFSMV